VCASPSYNVFVHFFDKTACSSLPTKSQKYFSAVDVNLPFKLFHFFLLKLFIPGFLSKIYQIMYRRSFPFILRQSTLSHQYIFLYLTSLYRSNFFLLLLKLVISGIPISNLPNRVSKVVPRSFFALQPWVTIIMCSHINLSELTLCHSHNWVRKTCFVFSWAYHACSNSTLSRIEMSWQDKYRIGLIRAYSARTFEQLLAVRNGVKSRH